MAHLLAHLKLVGELHAYANRIQSAFPESQPAKAGMSQGKLIEPLTNRELEVLSLLAERKTNKEIALQLGITLGTVRQHSYNLYQKLDVGNRRQAVTRAFELGVLKK
jgi:LuxR family maltose regulon positive regulatory protein